MALEILRQKIDKLDKELIEILNERAQISLQILQEKQKLKIPVYDQNREEQVLQKVMYENQGPLTSEQIKSIFQLIIKFCRELQLQEKGSEQW